MNSNHQLKNNFQQILANPSQNIIKIFNTNIFYDQKLMLGKGGFGQVYIGYNQQTKTLVAVKVLQTNKDPNSFQFQSILNQIQALKAITGQYILKYITHVFDLKKCYIVTQLCNQTLSDRIEKLRKLFGDLSIQFIKQVLMLFQKVVKGISQIHNSGQIHRDVKPLNVFLSNNGDPKIGDLGFCSKISQIKPVNQWKIGSKPYISPQILQFGQYSQSSDIWSIGVSLYEILFKQYPFSKKCLENAKIEGFYEELDILKQKFNKDKDQSKKYFVCKIYQMIISKCLNANPTKRIKLDRLSKQISLIVQQLSQKQIAYNVEKKGFNKIERFSDFFLKLNQILLKNDQKVTKKLKNSLKQCLQEKLAFSQEKILCQATTCYKKLSLILKLIKIDKDIEIYSNELQILQNLKRLIQALNDKQNMRKGITFSFLNKKNREHIEKLTQFSRTI